MINKLKSLLKANPRLAFLYLYSICAPIIGSGFFSTIVYKHENLFTNNIISLLAFITLTSFLMGIAWIPTTIVALISGYLLGIFGIIPAVIAYTLGSLIGYNLVKFLKTEKNNNSFKSLDNTKFIIDNIHKHEKPLIVLCRLSPILPFAIMNIFMASLKINVKNFLLYGSIGMLPRTLIFVYVGSQINDVLNIVSEGKSFPIVQISFITLLIVSSIGLISYAKKHILSNIEKK